MLFWNVSEHRKRRKGHIRLRWPHSNSIIIFKIMHSPHEKNKGKKEKAKGLSGQRLETSNNLQVQVK